MQPLFVHNLLNLSFWLVGLVIFRGMEVIVDIKSAKRLRRTGLKRQDKGSLVVILLFVAGGIFGGLALAFSFPNTTIIYARNFFFWLGIFLMYAGIALRFYAIATLGNFFTTTVAITPEQKVVETGPYRFIRHPSYTGVLLLLLGLSLSLTNWLSLLVIMGSGLISLSYRIWVEEQVLKNQFGQQYVEYMRRTKRLIPFIL